MLTDVKNSFFNGNPDYFREKLQEFVSQFNLNFEDIKDLSVSALIGRMLLQTDDGESQSLDSVDAGHSRSLDSVDTGRTGEDVEAIVTEGLVAVAVPKLERVEEVLKVDAWIELLCAYTTAAGKYSSHLSVILET